jgi:hypothetical protein
MPCPGPVHTRHALCRPCRDRQCSPVKRCQYRWPHGYMPERMSCWAMAYSAEMLAPSELAIQPLPNVEVFANIPPALHE